MTISPDDAKKLRLTGVLWLATYVTAIPAVLIYHPILQDHGGGYLASSGHETQIALGAFLELLLIISAIATAVVPYSIYRRNSEGLALGYVASRIMESMFIAVGLLSLMAAVRLHQDIGGAGADAAGLDAVGRSLVAVHDWSFNLGPGFVVGIGNGLIMGALMYRTGLMPRRLAQLGVVAGSLIVISGALVLFDVVERGSTITAIATAPEFFWELAIGFYLIFKYRTRGVASDQVAPAPA